MEKEKLDRSSCFHPENGCPFLLPMSRKKRPPMTKPGEKARGGLTARMEGGMKKIRRLENREKVLRQVVRFMRRRPAG